jgi:uncharacterized protein (DUF1810 family)
MADPFDLSRFVTAQESVLAQVRLELQAGCKRSHWMWFMFPQLAGPRGSATARFYSIGSLKEAQAYLSHHILGSRLIECTALVNAVVGRSAQQIFGYPDYLKFHSSMTLFALAQPNEPPFSDALRKYFDGIFDKLTVEKLALSIPCSPTADRGATSPTTP